MAGKTGRGHRVSAARDEGLLRLAAPHHGTRMMDRQEIFRSIDPPPATPALCVELQYLMAEVLLIAIQLHMIFNSRHLFYTVSTPKRQSVIECRRVSKPRSFEGSFENISESPIVSRVSRVSKGIGNRGTIHPKSIQRIPLEAAYRFQSDTRITAHRVRDEGGLRFKSATPTSIS
jgi:hypothetical protein